MSDVFSLFDEEVDASKFDKVNEDKGKTLSDLIRQSMKIDEDIAKAEQYLKDLKFKKRKVNEEDIPKPDAGDGYGFCYGRWQQGCFAAVRSCAYPRRKER